MDCRICNNLTEKVRVESENGTSEYYEALCDDCKQLPIAEMQTKVAEKLMKEKYFRAKGKFGSVDIQPIRCEGSRVIGYQLRQLIPDISREWKVEIEENGELSAYYNK